MKRFRILYLLLLGLLLTACSQETDLFLRSQERWELKTVASLNLAMLPSLGGEVEGFSLDFNAGALSASALEFTFGQIVSYCEGRGMEASWQKTAGKAKDETGYALTIRGQGWHLLSQLASPDPALLSILDEAGISSWPYGITGSEGEAGQVNFSMESPEGMALLGTLFPFTFRLHGREIVSSNADFAKDGVATWYNPDGQLEAVVTPTTDLLSGGTLAWVVGGIFLVGGGIALVVWLVTRRGSPARAGRGARPALRRPPTRRVPTHRSR